MKTSTYMLLSLAVAGCGTAQPTGMDLGTGSGDMAVESNVYVPFSSSNFQAQQVRVGLYEEMAAIRGAMGFDKTKCGDPLAPAAGTLAEAYLRNDATAGVLADKVKGRLDDHTYNMGAAIGVTMDATITKALADCTAGTLDPAVAAQIVDKTLQWFLYSSVYHELSLGILVNAESPEKWDEAFGYYGRSPDGATSRGISGTAKKRDENFKLTLNDTVYKALIDGRNKLAAMDTAGVGASATKIDQNLLTVFAYSTAREFALIPGSPQAAVYLAEGKSFFNILEPFMKSTAPADAKFIRDELDKADFAMPMALDNAGIVSRIEKAFGIDVTP